MNCFDEIRRRLEKAAYNHTYFGTDIAIDKDDAIEIVYDVEEEHCNLLDEIIGYLKNTNFAGEYECAIDNYTELFKSYGIDNGFFEICECIGDSVTSKGELEEFLKDYYKEVIKSVCNVIETYKVNQD